ncbi:MAG: UvrD-helicase domain-containing protein [Bacteroidales bacterium]
MSKLVVYKASAGSGKTYRLAAEYIKQVIKNPESFKQILAVTFTNKATAEMKGRILNELFEISTGAKTNMLDTIIEETSIDTEKVKRNAGEALSLILHDYSSFSISTIDSFVQRVIQSLLWEIGEQGGVDIELDTTPVLEHASDNLLDSASNISELLQWLTSMGHSLLDEGKSWDVRRKLMELGKQLFSEKFRLMDKDEVEKFTDKGRVTSLKKSLKELVIEIIQKIKEPAQNAIDELNSSGILPEQFSYGQNGVIGIFYKCIQLDESSAELPSTQSKRVLSSLNDPTGEVWVNKSTFNDKALFAPIEAIITKNLHQNLGKLINTIEKYNSHFISAKIILKNLENLALIGDLWNKVRELSREEGFLLLSDSGHLLREFVKESDAPFIYEKIGTRYDTFMIDEFQDTSEVQWHNFKPLIDNSLSQDYFSMIVGDVKQSIYRWRNGDWTILANDVDKDFAHHGVDSQKLDINWRSLPAIIDFNNHFFVKAKEIAKSRITGEAKETTINEAQELSKGIDNAYNEVHQEKNPSLKNDKGYVQFECLETDSKEYDEALVAEIPSLINEKRKNHRLGDIAILVRSKNDGQKIANMLLNYNQLQTNNENKIAFVSQEGLKLKSSFVVRVVIACFTLVQNTKDEIAKRVLAKELAELNENFDGSWHNRFDSNFLATEVDWLAQLNTRPLQEVFEAIAHRFNLFSVTGELAHLAELHEHIISTSSKGGGDVSRFLEWWSQNSGKLSLSVPDSKNAVSILTIHKSKGLEFPVVIIPYANWLYRNSSTPPLLWVETDMEPFNMLPKYPIHATKEAAQSLFAPNVFEENMKEVVDNLNLLYVAFTRAQKELFVLLPLSKSDKDKSGEKINTVSKLIWNVLSNENIPNIKSDTSIENDIQKDTFTLGEPYININKKSGKQNEDTVNWKMESYPVAQSYGGINLRMESEEFFSSTPSEKHSSVKHGKVMHSLFANIQTTNDIESAVKKMIAEGLVKRDARIPLQDDLTRILGNEPAKGWFSGEWNVKNEANILTPKGRTYRPDRFMEKNGQAIVVDFKFGAELPAHKKQLKNYINLISQMEYSSAKGYIWYVDKEHIVEV